MYTSHISPKKFLKKKMGSTASILRVLSNMTCRRKKLWRESILVKTNLEGKFFSRKGMEQQRRMMDT